MAVKLAKAATATDVLCPAWAWTPSAWDPVERSNELVCPQLLAAGSWWPGTDHVHGAGLTQLLVNGREPL